MKQLFFITLFIFVCWNTGIFAQGPEGRDFGFGLIVGEPTGLTGKYWTNSRNALEFNVGSSFFGRPRIDVDYLWHFNAFRTSIVKLYAGVGGIMGFGEGNSFWYEWRNGRFYYRTGNDIGLAISGLIGINVIPRDTPLEIFLDAGILIGMAPDFGSAGELAFGIRFYP